MVLSHPTAGEDTARAKDRRDEGDAARDVAFSTPATTNQGQARE